MSDNCRDCNGTGGFEGIPASQCPSCGRWSPGCVDNKSQSNDDVITSSDDDCTMPPVWANIVFDLETPEGERRLREMLDAEKIKLVLWDLDNWLREQWKYGTVESVPRYEVMAEVRAQLHGVAEHHGIRLDED